MKRPGLKDAPIAAGQVSLAGALRGVFGESAIWSSVTNSLWWVDLHGHAVIETAADGRCRYWKAPGSTPAFVRAIVAREAGGFVVALGDRLASFDPATGAFAALPIALDLPTGHMFNDAVVDPAGRLLIGTMLPGRGDDGCAALYRIDPDGAVAVLRTGLNTVNGLAFSPDGGVLYFSDSHLSVQRVWAAAYDIADGTPGAPEPFADFTALPGRPDGAAVDREGGYWSAAIGSPYLHRFRPDGVLDLSLELPVDTPTRPAFGGVNGATLYCTTGGLRSGETDDGVKGGVLRLTTRFTGAPTTPARL